MSLKPCHILAIFIGGTKVLVDDQGEWRSSIARDRVEGPARLDIQGFRGDQATKAVHGTPDQAVCLHSQGHYDFWNTTLQMNLGPGSVGENITLDAWDESDLCVGDILRMGTATIQVSGPRTPCDNQARFIGRPDWIKRTLRELRTGIYGRVLEPGTVQAGDRVTLELRLNPGLTIRDLAACYFHDFNTFCADRCLAAQGLMDRWVQRFRDKTDKINMI